MLRFIFLIFLLLPVCQLKAKAASDSLQAGAAKYDITPRSFPVSMTGSFQDRKAQSAHDPLHARALVLKSGDTSIAFVV